METLNIPVLAIEGCIVFPIDCTLTADAAALDFFFWLLLFIKGATGFVATRLSLLSEPSAAISFLPVEEGGIVLVGT